MTRLPYRFALHAASASLVLTLVLSGHLAHASGVTAGTLIQNTATATFSSGTTTGTVQSNTVSVRVDELLDVAVTGLTSSLVATGSSTVVLVYSITNTGNGPESYRLTADPAVSGNAFDTVIQSIAVDTDGDGTYTAGTDQIIATGGATSLVGADTSLTVFVLATLPGSANDSETSQVRLTVDASTGTGPAGTVFAGQGNGGGDAVVGSSGASDFGLDSIAASLAAVSLAKSAAIADPFGGSQPVPGAIVTYTLVATIAGSGNADNLRVTDAIPAGTTYQPGTLKLEGLGLSDAADTDEGSASSSGIDVLIGTVPGGSTKTVKFDIKIN